MDFGQLENNNSDSHCLKNVLTSKQMRLTFSVNDPQQSYSQIFLVSLDFPGCGHHLRYILFRVHLVEECPFLR